MLHTLQVVLHAEICLALLSAIVVFGLELYGPFGMRPKTSGGRLASIGRLAYIIVVLSPLLWALPILAGGIVPIPGTGIVLNLLLVAVFTLLSVMDLIMLVTVAHAAARAWMRTSHGSTHHREIVAHPDATRKEATEDNREALRPASIAALDDIYLGGDFNLGKAVQLFGQGATNEVRQRLGYADGQDWFVHAPIGLLYAELMTTHEKAMAKGPMSEWAMAQARAEVGQHSAAMALAFTRYDLLVATMLYLSEAMVDVPDPARVHSGPVTSAMFDTIMARATPKVLNRDIDVGAKRMRLWKALFIGFPTAASQHQGILTRLVKAGAANVYGKLGAGDKPGLTGSMIREAWAEEEARATEIAQRELMAQANGYTSVEEEQIALREAAEEAQGSDGILVQTKPSERP